MTWKPAKTQEKKIKEKKKFGFKPLYEWEKPPGDRVVEDTHIEPISTDQGTFTQGMDGSMDEWMDGWVLCMCDLFTLLAQFFISWLFV